MCIPLQPKFPRKVFSTVHWHTTEAPSVAFAQNFFRPLPARMTIGPFARKVCLIPVLRSVPLIMLPLSQRPEVVRGQIPATPLRSRKSPGYALLIFILDFRLCGNCPIRLAKRRCASQRFKTTVSDPPTIH
ncbi:hypothetical protein, unlikely [Trypanosoma brucei brucei TREU927]|uniref:Uncharacterized protein n=2 Tax=Trypanosoma brucei brucei (strain 927/4 GUTat10.1) TaxID=185431 RepID=Q38E12_TRYB2|nr:hypothetical protein, unlikely [Trypanosoma brucei brucei TREU927]EAN76958.1 hypothetical protein, unlikely [Trypanosoma brucei brucei TREU927]